MACDTRSGYSILWLSNVRLMWPRGDYLLLGLRPDGLVVRAFVTWCIHEEASEPVELNW